MNEKTEPEAYTLRACPLCGGKPEFAGAPIFGGLLNNLCIRCTVCEMETRSGQFREYRDLVDFWNRWGLNKDSALLEAAESLSTICSSGYSEEYERGWNNAVKHNRTKLKAMAGDQKAIAEMGWCKASNE